MKERKSLILAMLCFGIVLLFSTLTAQAMVTTEVHVVKYAADGTTILNGTTVNYTWMRDNLPIMDEDNLYGTDYTHYYFQGPTFNEYDIWNPAEDTNVESRDYGAVAGTNVKDLCELVGGMSPGDEIKIKSPDGFFKWFAYENVYDPDTRQGPLVLAWYNGEESITGDPQGVGYPDTGYHMGMRLVFFADSSINPWGYHCFGEWDMHECLAEKYWHYYYDGTLWPSSSGLSVKWVNEVAIYTAEEKSDLIVTTIDNPEEIYTNTSNIISATIENIGNRSALPFSVTLDDGNGVVDAVTLDIDSLSAGESTTVKFLWTPTASTDYTLTVTADADDAVDEEDETNNQMTEDVTSIEIPQSDLVVTRFHDGNVFAGEPNVLFVLIKNKGVDSNSFNVSLAVDDEIKAKAFVPMLYTGETQMVSFDWTPTTTGGKTLSITVDCDDDVTESDETNNVMSQTVDVTSIITENVDDGQSIQSVIDTASNGTKILVTGIHNECITIPSTKSSIRLIADGTDSLVYSNNPGDIIKLEGTDCWVKGFTINSTWYKDDSDDDEDFANYPGAGINITSPWNVIEDNYIYNSSSGVNLYSSYNLFRCNTIGDTEYGRDCRRLMIITGDCNNVVKNVFDGNTTRHNWALGGVLNYTARLKYRVASAPATFNLLRDNSFNVTGSEGPCILFRGDQNLIFNNYIYDTKIQNVELGRFNWYNVNKVAAEDPACGNIVHGPYLGGNYWTDYTGTDNDDDLLGDTDTPYSDVDYHPLIIPPSHGLCGDVNGDGLVNVLDATKVKNRAADPFYPLDNEWAADVNCDGVVNVLDATKVKNRAADPFYPLGCCA